MTKADIADKPHESFSDLPKAQCFEFVDTVFSTMKKTLASGEEVKISKFGKFELQDKRARNGRNPKTGEKLIISKRRIVAFKVSNALRDEMNAEPITQTPEH